MKDIQRIWLSTRKGKRFERP